MYMLELLQHQYLGIVLIMLLLVSTVITIFLVLSAYRAKRDILKLSDSLRVLLRTGRSPEGIRFSNGIIEGIWRRVVAYYGGVIREKDSKNDVSQILASGRGIIEASLEDNKILEVLCEVLYKSASPEAVFVCAATKENNSWIISSSIGVSKFRLEDPITLALDKIPLEHRNAIYTQPGNGLEFDFRALGVGLSLFVPLKTESSDITGVVWIGFSELSGVIPEGKKHTLELIAQHAIAAYTKSKERNNTRKLDEKKREEIFALSHDMKAPGTRALYAIRELDNLLEMRRLNDEQVLVQEIEYALIEQVDLIDKLFSVELGEVPRNQMRPTIELDVGALVRSRVEVFRIVAKSVGLNLTVSELVKVKSKVSRDSLHRILDNLISNSIKYSVDGTIEVVLSAEASNLRIEVRDNGLGVDPEIQEVLFSSKARNAKSVVGQGHRYGLTVVKSLAEEAGGTVGFRANLPRGSVFFVELPCTKVLPIEVTSNASLQVLVIDDDPLVRATHERWLASLGLRVYGVASFKEALDHITIKKPDVVITDMMLPGEIITRFLELVPDNIDVFVISGRNRSKVESELREYSSVVKAVLEKPVSKAQLRDLIYANSSRMDGIAPRLKVA